MENKYITYRRDGRVDYHKFLIMAMIKAIYQSKILGVDSSVDTYANDGSIISIKWYDGLIFKTRLRGAKK